MVYQVRDNTEHVLKTKSINLRASKRAEEKTLYESPSSFEKYAASTFFIDFYYQQIEFYGSLSKGRAGASELIENQNQRYPENLQVLRDEKFHDGITRACYQVSISLGYDKTGVSQSNVKWRGFQTVQRTKNSL